MSKKKPGSKNGLFGRLKSAITGDSKAGGVRLEQPIDLPDSKIRVVLEGSPIQIALGKHARHLCLYPETLLSQSKDNDNTSYVLLDPDQYFSTVSGFLRFTPGDTLTLGRSDENQNALFDYSKEISKRHLKLTHEGDTVVFRNLTTDAVTRIEALTAHGSPDKLSADRLEKLEKVREIFGGPLEALASPDALELIEQVNGLMENEIYRERDFRGLPGGLVTLPEELLPVIVGDLHTQVDNLLSVLTRSGVLEGLERGEVCLVLLGDAVHSERDGELDFMDSSMLIMDLIFRLKVRFPDQLFYIRGNHDSFSEEIAKQGIPQGLIWAQILNDKRGKAYKDAMERFYELIAYMVCSKRFIACHAAAPKAKLSKDMLVDVNKYPALMKELISNRMQRPNRPAGYTKGDIRRLRKSLGAASDTPFIVGHTPLDPDHTLWENAGGIENHYVLYSADSHWTGLMIVKGKKIIPLRYPVEQLLPVLNRDGLRESN